MEKRNQVAVIHTSNLTRLEEDLNHLCERYNVIQIDNTVSKHGYVDFYTCIVLYNVD